jgi:hypothetical protein
VAVLKETWSVAKITQGAGIVRVNQKVRGGARRWIDGVERECNPVTTLAPPVRPTLPAAREAGRDWAGSVMGFAKLNPSYGISMVLNAFG